MKTQIIQLDSHDDLISARDKMSWSKAPRILLVWPPKGKVLERPVDLLILQRYGLSLGAQIGIVSGSLQIQGQARELGIPSFRSISQAQRQAWRRPRGKKRINLRFIEHKPSTAGLRDQYGLIIAGRNAVPESGWMRTAVFSLGVAAVFVLMLLFLPSARVRLSPEQREQQLELDFRASPDIPAANASGGMPAYAVTVVVEGSDQERSSGKVKVPTAQASGRVEISNLNEREVVLPAGTVFATTGMDVIRYESVREVRVPAGVGSKAEVEIRALIPGTSGNNPSGTVRAMEGTVGLSVAVDNPRPIGGGSDQLSPGPSADDYTHLRERLLDSLRETAIADLKRNLGAESRLLDGTVSAEKVMIENLSPSAGQPGDYARLTMQVEFTAWYVSEDDLQTVALSALEANRVEGFSPLLSPVTVDFIDQPTADSETIIKWRAEVKRSLFAAVDSERAARAIAGKTPQEAAAFLEKNYLLDEPAQVLLSPRWWFRLPFLSFRIRVEMD